MLLARLYLQVGTYIDYYTGEHEPSLSGQLREALETLSEAMVENEAEGIIGERHSRLFPQFSIGNSKDDARRWPPTVLIHGTDDTAVPIHESRNLYRLLKSSRHEIDGKGASASGAVEDLLIEVPGVEHSFDLAPDAEEKFGNVFEKVVEFVHRAVLL